jgi:hypothetical protein
MFDDSNSKKNEKVDDIFADTDTNEPSKKDESSNLDSAPKTNISEKEQAENKKELKEEKKEIEVKKFDANKLKETNDKSWLKPVIIGVLIIILAIVIYFIYGAFSSDDEDLVILPTPNNQEEDDFSPSSPELIDPALIIPEPIEEPDFITEEPEIEEEEEEEIEEEIIVEEVYEINLLNYSFIDSDSDGLSDLAEEFMGTDPNNPDTDGDSYSDYEELINGYNPLGDGLLADDFPALIYEDNNLFFYYPRNFVAEKNDNNSWSLIAPDDARINIERETTNYDNLFNWYQDEFDDYSWISEERQIINKELGRAIISSDASMIFMLSKETNYLFKIDLEISENNDFNYYSQLALIVNTLIQR